MGATLRTISGLPGGWGGDWVDAWGAHGELAEELPEPPDELLRGRGWARRAIWSSFEEERFLKDVRGHMRFAGGLQGGGRIGAAKEHFPVTRLPIHQPRAETREHQTLLNSTRGDPILLYYCCYP